MSRYQRAKPLILSTGGGAVNAGWGRRRRLNSGTQYPCPNLRASRHSLEGHLDGIGPDDYGAGAAAGTADFFRQFLTFSKSSRKTNRMPRIILVPNQSIPRPIAAMSSAPRM